MRIRAGVLITTALILAFTLALTFQDPVPERAAVKVIVAEAADQRVMVMIGIAEVIRNRARLTGFTAANRKDFEAFVAKQPRKSFRRAHLAWRLSRWTDFTHSATHFEYVKAYGPPKWDPEMIKTFFVDGFQFYRRPDRWKWLRW